MSSGATYPVRVEAQLDPNLSRWVWLVKWLLAVPHYFVLAFLWMAFFILSVIAFFAILFTERYPRSIFEFNVGVLRWTWRVAYYSNGALGTDRYPPFTLAEDPQFPAHLDVAYPERLSRGLVLVKWWLLALPHYLIVGALAGGAAIAWQSGDWRLSGPGLIGLFVLIAGVALMFTGKYPHGLFNLILGLDRWVLRVAAYAGLMTDDYPPFRLDMGGSESGTLTLPPHPGPSGSAAPTQTASRGWTGGSVVAVIVAALVSLLALGLLAAGGGMLWADRTQRDGGYVTTPVRDFETDSHAIVAEVVDVRADGPGWLYPRAVLDEARIRVTAAQDAQIFVGVGRSADVTAYLDGVAHATLVDPAEGRFTDHPGGAPATAPQDQPFWLTSTEGPGTQTLNWEVRNGSWTVVAMNADTDAGLAVRADAGATIPSLPWIAAGVLAFGALLLIAGGGVIAGAISRASRAVEART